MKTLDNLNTALQRAWNETGESAVNQEELGALHKAMGVRAPVHKKHLNKWMYAFAVAAAIAIGEFAFLTRPAKPVETLSLVTAADSKGYFTLPDGSHVWLNSSSKLSYNSENPRIVSLEGEGFFDVAKSENSPFIVSSSRASVKVYGTRFNFRCSSLFDCEEVALLSGKVEVSSGSQSVMLAPGEKATVADGGIAKEDADVTCDSSWTGEELVFQNASMDSIFNNLEHWYNIRFKIGPGIDLSRRLSFKIRNESAGETFTILNRLSGCRFKALDENNIIVTK